MSGLSKKILSVFLCAAMLTGCLPTLSEEIPDAAEIPEEIPVEESTEEIPAGTAEETEVGSETVEAASIDTDAMTEEAAAAIIGAMANAGVSGSVEKAEWLYDALISTASHGSGSTAYDALVGAAADSVGYAQAYALLLGKAGITAQVITGDTAWVAADLGGWTHIDVYADDASDCHGKSFGLTDAAMALKHSWDRNSSPACSSYTANYYVRHGGYTPIGSAEELYTLLTSTNETVKIYNYNMISLADAAGSFGDITFVYKEDGCYASVLASEVLTKAEAASGSSITPSVTSLTLGVGQTYQITYTTVPASSVASFYTNDSAVCTVSNTGVIEAVKAGSNATITLAINGAAATVSVTTLPAPTGISVKSDRYLSSDGYIHVGKGETIHLDHTTTPSSAKESANVTYTITGNTNIATITDTGMLTGVNTGETVVKLTCYSGPYATAKVMVVAAPAGITLGDEALTIGLGENTSCKATIIGDTYNIFSATYTSSNESIVTVNANGVVSAVGVGEADITATTYNGYTASRHVIVDAAPDSLTLSGSYTTVAIGEPIQLTCTLMPENSISPITWTSSSTRIATVSSDGLVTPKKAGTVTITAKAYNGVYGTYKLTVKKAATKATLSASRTQIGVGEQVTTAYTLKNFTNSFEYYVSDSSIATIDAAGVVTGIAPGTVQVRLKAGKVYSNIITISVLPAPESVTATVHDLAICLGDSATLGYTLSAGSISSISYESSNPGVVYVDGSGVVTAVAQGTATVTMRTYNGKTDTCNVTVYPAPESLTLTASRTEMGVGETMQLTTILDPAGVPCSVTYSSSKTKNLTVSATGLVTAKKAGTITVTAKTYNNKTAQFKITVKKAPSSVTLSAARTTLGVGEEIQTSYSFPSKTSGSVTQYEISPTDNPAATIDANGKITAVHEGTVQMRCVTYNGKRSNIITITVVPAPTSVAAASRTLTICEGDKTALPYTLSAGSAGSVDYISDNSAVIAANADGTVSAVSRGTATVTLRTYNGLTDSCVVTVSQAPDAVTLYAEHTTLGVGEQIQLTTGTVPEGLTCSMTYSTNKAKVATVSENGLVTAKKKGTAVITVKTYNGKTAQIKITVQKAPSSIKLAASRTSIGLGEYLATSYTLSKGAACSGVTYVSENPGIVYIDANGVIYGAGVGTARIKATTYNGKSSNLLTITVTDAPRTLACSTSSVQLGVGETYSLSYVLSDSCAGAVSYTSDNAGIASVDPSSGLVTAVYPGTCAITLTTYNGITAVCNITVKAAPTSVQLTAPKTSIGVGEQMQVSAVFPDGCYSGTLTYSVSSKKIAAIDANGILYGKKAGTVTVKVTTYNKKTATLKIAVAAAPSAVAFSSDSFTIGAGESLNLLSYVQIPNKTSCSCTFATSNANICAVDSLTGVVTGISYGSATISVTTHNGMTNVCTVYVKAAPTSIALSVSTVLGVGQQTTAYNVLGPDETNYASFTRAYSVTSGSNCITVDAAGTVSAVAAGTAVLRVSTYLPNVYAEQVITVMNAPTYVQFPASSYTINVGDTLQLSPMIDNGAATLFTYAAAKDGYLTIDGNGLVTGVSRGTTTIKVTTHNNLQATVGITVVDPYFPDSASWTNVDDNPPVYMTCSASLADQYPMTWTPKVDVYPSTAQLDMVWASSNESVLSYDSSSGQFIAVSYGTATVTGTSSRNPSITLTAKIAVCSQSSDPCLVTPAEYIDISGKSAAQIVSAISENETKMNNVQAYTVEVLESLVADGAITSSEMSKRQAIISRAFAMIDFPWYTTSKVAYWTNDYDKSPYNHSKDYKTGLMYFGLPYTQTNRKYNQSNIVSAGYYKSTSNSCYQFNDSYTDRLYHGNDCSSFVSQCEWSNRYDNTTAIASSSKYTTLNSATYATQMRPGDILVRSGHHVVMFLYYTNAERSQFMIIEQGGSDDYHTNVIACRIKNFSNYEKYTIRRPKL